jgi:transposase
MSPEKKISYLAKKIDDLIELVNHLYGDIKDLNRELKSSQRENKMLKEKLAKYEHPKNSNNSSIPPSKDENRAFKSKSLRKKTGRKPGGQKGHEGTTLEMTTDPDQTIEHTPDYCECCGKDIGSVTGEFVARRQEVDIPPIKPVITEHRIYKKQCSCGHITTSDFPNGITAPISYGPMIESLTGYFHSRQYIPFKRMQEIFRDIFSVPISEGGIHYLLNRLCDKAHPWYKKIWEQVMHSSVVGSDETGGRLNGKKIWVWTWQNVRFTWLTGTDNRGYKTIEDSFPTGFADTVLVHDCWRSHFQTGVQTHQLCTAHLLRELKYLEERYLHRWPIRFTKFILDGLELKKQLNPGDYYQPLQKRTELEKRLDRLLASRIDQNHKELVSFQKRMLKYKDYILTFLYHPKVPPDNNGSEQAIRNVKVKQKVSGQFKSWKGVNNFLILRSITDTALKNKQPVLNALNLIAKFEGTD